jgi:hypothetical protein
LAVEESKDSRKSEPVSNYHDLVGALVEAFTKLGFVPEEETPSYTPADLGLQSEHYAQENDKLIDLPEIENALAILSPEE